MHRTFIKVYNSNGKKCKFAFAAYKIEVFVLTLTLNNLMVYLVRFEMARDHNTKPHDD